MDTHFELVEVDLLGRYQLMTLLLGWTCRWFKLFGLFLNTKVISISVYMNIGLLSELSTQMLWSNLYYVDYWDLSLQYT